MNISKIILKLHELLWPKSYKLCLTRDLYLLSLSDGKETAHRTELLAVFCAKENIPQSILREVVNNPLVIRDCYPQSAQAKEKYIYLLSSMLLVEGNVSENALDHYKYPMYKLGLDDADMVKVIVALGQTNPKFQTAAISYMANVDMETLTELGKRSNNNRK